jgi:predicted DsbA family dithiol-disulfide isomerase
MNKKLKFNVKLFVAGSFVALALFGVLCLFAGAFFAFRSPSAANKTANDIYFFNKNRPSGDPLITHNPNLSDMLKGPIISVNDPNLGYDDAPVVIVEYSDFACKYCYEEEQVIKRLIQDHKYDVKLIWKDYPETDQMSGSYTAALAARCAGKQGMFWPFHDMLFDGNNDLSRNKYLEIAGIFGLNIDDFTACFDNKETKSAVDDNITEAQALDIVGVPFIFIDDQEVMGRASYDNLEAIVKSELKKVKPSP